MNASTRLFRNKSFLLTVSIVFFLYLYRIIFLNWINCDPVKLSGKMLENKITPKHLKILINPNGICKIDEANKLPFVFSYVFNKADNFIKRNAIRKTWANKLFFPNFKIAFMVGLSTDENINRLVKEESDRFGDIVVGNYLESLKNLSFKSVMAWQWINTNCKNADYILKVDDDTVVDTFTFTNFINELFKTNRSLKNTYFCEILKGLTVERKFFAKYYIECEEYGEDYYKDFCNGVANIITPDLIPKLHEASYTARPFWVDDAYVGFITNSLNVSMVDIVDKIVYNSKKENVNVNDTTFLFVRDADTSDDIYKIWDFIMEKHV